MNGHYRCPVGCGDDPACQYVASRPFRDRPCRCPRAAKGVTIVWHCAPYLCDTVLEVGVVHWLVLTPSVLQDILAHVRPGVPRVLTQTESPIRLDAPIIALGGAIVDDETSEIWRRFCIGYV